MCPTRHFVYIFFNLVFQLSTAKNEINLFNNHVLMVAPVTFTLAGAMTPSANFLFSDKIVCLAENSHKMPSRIFSKKKIIMNVLCYTFGLCFMG